MVAQLSRLIKHCSDMHSKWVFKHFHTKSRGQLYTLAALWFLSLIAGILLCVFCSNDSAYMLDSATAVAPLGLLFVCVVPVVFTAFTLAFSLFCFTCLTVCISGLSHGFCGFLIYIEQGNAAWLLRPLFLFSATGASVLIWWLILQNEAKRSHRKFLLAGTLSCLIYIFDLLVVSPFAGDLVKYF